MPEAFCIQLAAGDRVSARLYPASPQRRAGITFVLAHGAGAGQMSPFLVRFATGFAARGIDAVTFNFAYMERRRRVPDPNANLEHCYRAAIRTVRDHAALRENLLTIGGKSMGGRIASQVVAAGVEGISALVFLGYPLHPPGKPNQLRDRHLTKIGTPMLFVQGSRDAFGTPDELRPILERISGPAELQAIEGADHSFKVPKRSGHAQEAVYETILDGISTWLRRL